MSASPKRKAARRVAKKIMAEAAEITGDVPGWSAEQAHAYYSEKAPAPAPATSAASIGNDEEGHTEACTDFCRGADSADAPTVEYYECPHGHRQEGEQSWQMSDGTTTFDTGPLCRRCLFDWVIGNCQTRRVAPPGFDGGAL